MINPRSIDDENGGFPLLKNLLKLDDLSSIELWTAEPTCLDHFRSELQERIRQKLSVCAISKLQTQVTSAEQTPSSSPMGRSPSASSCRYCSAARLLLRMIEKEAATVWKDILKEMPIDLIELPRLGISFRSERLIAMNNGKAWKSIPASSKLCCDQHDGFFISRRLVSSESLTRYDFNCIYFKRDRYVSANYSVV